MMRVGRSCFEGLSDMRHFHLLPLILLAGCGDTGSSTNQFAAEENNGSIQNQASVNALPDNDMEAPLNPPAPGERGGLADDRSAEHTSELQSLMRISYAVFCLKQKQN